MPYLRDAGSKIGNAHVLDSPLVENLVPIFDIEVSSFSMLFSISERL